MCAERNCRASTTCKAHKMSQEERSSSRDRKGAGQSPARTQAMPTYLITFTTYGQWLHGDARGSVDRHHNQPDAPPLPANPDRVTRSRKLMAGAPYRMDERRRGVVLVAIR